MNQVTTTQNGSGFSNTDFVIEAIFEDMGVKQKTLSELEGLVNKDTIIASNTSSLDIDQLAGSLKKKDRFIGMHFFSPANLMPLVEIIPSKHTSEATIATAFQLAKKLKRRQ